MQGDEDDAGVQEDYINLALQHKRQKRRQTAQDEAPEEEEEEEAMMVKFCTFSSRRLAFSPRNSNNNET